MVGGQRGFAAQTLSVTRELGLDPQKVNPNGLGISLGHVFGATGAVIAVKALYESNLSQSGR